MSFFTVKDINGNIDENVFVFGVFGVFGVFVFPFVQLVFHQVGKTNP